MFTITSLLFVLQLFGGAHTRAATHRVAGAGAPKPPCVIVGWTNNWPNPIPIYSPPGCNK